MLCNIISTTTPTEPLQRVHSAITPPWLVLLFIIRDLDAAYHTIANRQKKKAQVHLKPSPFTVEKSAVRGLPSLSRSSASFKVQASGVKKIKTATPYGTGGGMDLRNGVDASGRKPTGKGVYQFVDKYGANVDGYSPIYNKDEWAPSGDVYAGGENVAQRAKSSPETLGSEDSVAQNL
ncbi:photosystem II 10 kDa polypeptide [Pyrus ussuriensis x Pyrus communis]|uniref:Photosystem II 10 kDa polypeptide, chloroplastic n=1 Tax=Pyrus ussuriensis x Pyrus communis TaxID=2448454 RepID=A0A5N5FGF9_9ROSA|nr:photosystem II 10 kDa polypeptide [Pyrus ussuriensis x Pyrus communis]